MLVKISGVVINQLPYKNTSKIINVFTSEGIIGIIASVYSLKKYTSYTNKLIYGTFYINKRAGLSTLIEVNIISDFKLNNYTKFITSLVTQVYKHESNSNIYTMYIDSLYKIKEKFDPLVITNILEVKLLEYLSIMPVIDRCVICNNTSDIISISSYKGGCVCKNCLNEVVVVNTKIIKFIRMYYYVDIAKIIKLDISDNITKEINRFLDEYYDRYAGLYLKKYQLGGCIK